MADKEIYKPREPTTDSTTISHTIIAARKRIINTIMNAITTTCTATVA